MRRGIRIGYHILGNYPESAQVLAPFYPYNYGGRIVEVEMYLSVNGLPFVTLGKRVRYLDSYGLSRLPAEILQRIDPKLLTARRRWHTSLPAFAVLFIAFLFFANSLYLNMIISSIPGPADDETFIGKPRIGDIYCFRESAYVFNAEVHGYTKDSVCFTVCLPSETVSSGDPAISPERRAAILDSLVPLYPQEPFLRQLIYEQLLDTNFRHGFIRVPQQVLSRAFCSAKRRGSGDCPSVVIDAFREKTSLPVRIEQILRLGKYQLADPGRRMFRY